MVGSPLPLVRALVATLVVLAAPVADRLGTYAPAPRPAAIVRSADGFAFVDSGGARVGDGALRTYRVEVEPATGVDPRVFTEVVDRVLGDQRGWTTAGDWALQRTADHAADVRVLLATPATVDRLCARAGLDTGGRVSCFNGRFAALNLERWKHGADGFDGPLGTYRQYLLNHEVGHALGYSHQPCPRAGARAPVMQQQTHATTPCRANGWPTLDP